MDLLENSALGEVHFLCLLPAAKNIVDGEQLQARERSRIWRSHAHRGAEKNACLQCPEPREYRDKWM